MKRILIILFCWVSLQSSAQQLFLEKGKIFYERRIAQITLQESYSDEEWLKSPFYEEIKKVYPKVISDLFILDFDATQSVYRLGDESGENKYMMGMFKPGEKEYIYQHIKEGIQISYIDFFEKKYMVKDSLTSYNWKLTGETREIAGFECKKALTTIADSVVVVAFYTDEITPSVGPMGFHGLPGTILGIAIPRLYLNLFATKIERSDVPIKLPYKPTDKFVSRNVIWSDFVKTTDIDLKRKPLFKWMIMLK